MSFGLDKLAAIQDKGILLAVHIYNEMVLDWIKQIKRQDTFREAEGLTLKLKPDVAELLNDAMLVSYLQGMFRSKQEIAYQLERGKVMKFAERAVRPANGRLATFADLTQGIDFASTPYREAIDWFQEKGVVSASQFKQLSSMMKQISFSIAGIEQKRILEVFKGSLDDALSEGMTYRQWAKSSDQIFTRYGVTPLSPHHLETVFRTNTMSAYSVAKYETTINDDNVVGFEYVAIMDDRTRDEHAAMNGFKAAKDDPVWNTWWPPNDYNCRCTTIPLTDYYMDRNELRFNDEVPDGAAVSPDFDGKMFTLNSYYSAIRSKLKEA